MKKKTTKIVTALILLFVAVFAIGFFLVRNSPEYALWTIAKDVQSEGIEGVKPHLAGDALDLVEKLDGISDNRVVNAISSILNTDRFAETLESKLSQIEWTLDDIERSASSAEISLRFKYENKLTGVVVLDMIRESSGWKISGADISGLDRP